MISAFDLETTQPEWALGYASTSCWKEGSHPDGEPQVSPANTFPDHRTLLPRALLDRNYSELVSLDHPEAIAIRGTIYDGAGEVVPDAMVEIWQANSKGRYDHLADDGMICPTKISRASDARAQMEMASSPS